MDRLPTSPDHRSWGFLDPALEPVLTVDDGTELTIEAVTHHVPCSLLLGWISRPASEAGDPDRLR